VHLAGESQGAWAISETVKDPAMRARVSRMVLLGHPWVASTHYDDGHDPNVMEINRRVDIITRPLNGDAQGAVEAVEQIFQRKIGNIGKLVRALVDNPLSAYLLALTGIRLLTPGGPDRDPHNYEDAMNAAVQFLRV